nr:MAG: polyprotein [Canine picornavirus]
MACKHGYPEEANCPLCTALAFDGNGYALLRDGDWFPTDLLVFDLEDDVFHSSSRTPSLSDMDWTPDCNFLDTPMELQGNGQSANKNNSQSSGNTGTIINNYYSNNYQNSIDLGTTGGNAGGAQTQPGFLSNLLGNAVNAFGSSLPMLADQNTEEMENLSDRVAKDIAGNSATNTQSTVGRLFGFGRRHKGEHPASCADTATDKVLAAERYYTVKLVSWTSSQQSFDFVRLPLPHTLAGENGGVFGSTLRRHYLLKCGWRVQVQCNASQFHSGCLLVFFAPEFPTGSNFYPDTNWVQGSQYLTGTGTSGAARDRIPFSMDHQNFWQWPVYPHQFLNLRTNTTVDLEVPFVNICPTSSWTQHAVWTLVVAVVSPLRYTTGASTSIEITASIQPVNPVFNGLRHETLQAQSPFPVTVREHAGMWSSTVPDTTVPIYGQTPTAPHDYMVGQFNDLLELAMIPTFMGNVDSDVRRPYITTQNDVPTTPLATYQVTLACSCLANTMLAATARNFNQYRGSLNYTFMFTGCAMAKGKFLLSYTPPGAGTPTTRDQAMQGTYAVWDLGLNSTFNFTVPFISPSHYRLTNYAASTITTVDGWLTIWQLTPLTYPPGAPTVADIITMASAGSDFSFKHPISPTPWQPQGVDNAEKGEVSNDSAKVDFVAEPIPLPENQTKVAFFYDRASPLGTFQANTALSAGYTFGGTNNRPNNLLLTPLPVFNGGDNQGSAALTARQDRILWPLKTSSSDTTLVTKQDYPFLSYSPFTYFKCDLEVVVAPNTVANAPLMVKWSPTGAPDAVEGFNISDIPSIRVSRNPVMYTTGPGSANQISFVVPYNSPLSVLPAVWYAGFLDFANTPPMGIAPNADFGRLYFMSQTGTPTLSVYVRYKNMKVFCPRPALFFPWPAANVTKVRADPSPFPLMNLESPDSFFRVDLFIHFLADKIVFDYKIQKRTIRHFVCPSQGLSHSGRLLVCLGEQPVFFYPQGSNHLYHVIFDATWHSSSMSVFNGRYRSWKKPLHEELNTQGFRTFSEFFQWVKDFHKYYYENRLIHDVETNPGPGLLVPPPDPTYFRPSTLAAQFDWHFAEARVRQQEADAALAEIERQYDEIIERQSTRLVRFCRWICVQVHRVTRLVFAGFHRLRLMHDIETNPGPVMSVFQEQGGVLTKSRAPADILSNSILSLLGMDTDAQEFKQVYTVLKDLVGAWEKAKATLHSPEFWTKLVLRTVKFISACVLYHHHPDITTFLCLSVMTGVDILTNNDIFEWIKNKLSRLFRTSPPPAPGIQMEEQGPLRDTNEGFTFAKNLEWAVKTIKSIVDWIVSWFKQEEQTPQNKLDQMLVEFPDHVNMIMDLRAGKKSYIDCKKAFDYFDQLYKLAVICNKVPLANLCEKFKSKHDHSQARVEPVVVVLRGAAGQGKSMASQIIGQSVSKMQLGRQSVYSLPPDSDYFDGYENQYSVLMDDLGQNPDGEDFTVFCQMVSSTNFLPNMAHLENKGTPFTSQCIIATTNLSQFRPVTIAHYPAVERRITFDFTVHAGEECRDAKGCLDVAKAMEQLEGKPQLDVFTKNCKFLHKCGLYFEDNRSKPLTHKVYNIQQVIHMIVEALKVKANNLDQINNLVLQSPDYVDRQAFEAAVTCLRQRQAATQEELEELQDAFNHAVERSNAIADWMKISAIAFACVASLSAVIKIVSRVKKAFWPSPREMVISEPEQAAYAGKPRAQKTALQVFDVQGGALLAQSGNPVMDFEIYCAKNVVVPIRFYYQDGSSAVQSCLLLKDRMLVTNRHMAETDWVQIEVRDAKHARETVRCFSANRGSEELDLTFMKVPNGPLFKNNVNKFASKEDSFPNKDSPVVGIMNVGCPFLFQGKFLLANHPVNTTTGRVYANCFHYRANTMKGWCGSAVIGQSNGKKVIYGMHSAGGAGLAAATIITKEMIEKAELCFGMDPQGVITPLEDGSVVHVPRKSKIKKTIAYNLFQPNYDTAVLSRYDSRAQACVDDVAFSKHTQNVEEFPEVFSMVCKEYANRVFTKLGKDNGIITVKQAVLGQEGLDPMEKDTSPGLPYTQKNQRRTDLIDFETGQMSAELDFAHSRLLLGDYSKVLYQSFLKDEIRPLEKVQAAKTRIVDVPPFEHCIFGRQLLGRFASKYQTNPGLELGSAIGTDPDTDWTKFATEMSQYKYVYDVDYSNFDASHGTGIFEVLIECFFTQQNGFDQRLADYLRSLAVSTHAYEERRLLIRGGLPSGCAATSMLNTIINNVVIRAGLYMTYKNFEFDDVKILSYGDDLLVATNYQIDFNLVKQKLANFNYKITPANKTTEFPLVSSLKDVTFLKRKFTRFNSYLFKPEMSPEALKAMVSFCKPGTLKEKLQSIAILAVHSGPDVYDEIFEPFRRLGFVIPEYSTMLYRWLNLFR